MSSSGTPRHEHKGARASASRARKPKARDVAKECIVDHRDYKLGKALGTGSFATAYRATQISTGKTVVVKRLEKLPPRDDPSYASLARMVYSEIAIMHRVGSHRNLVSLKGWFYDDEGVICMVLSHCGGGSLASILKAPPGNSALGSGQGDDDGATPPTDVFPEAQLMMWFVQLLSGLHHLHERQVMHRDIKPANIFLSKSLSIVRLGDLGVAKELDKPNGLAATILGTPYYMSPEIMANKPYTLASDIWSLGCVLYEMAARRTAFDAAGLPQLVMRVMRNAWEPLPSYFSAKFRQLVQMMLRADPEQRPTTAQLLGHPFVRQHLAAHIEASRSGGGGRTSTLDVLYPNPRTANTARPSTQAGVVPPAATGPRPRTGARVRKGSSSAGPPKTSPSLLHGNDAARPKKPGGGKKRRKPRGPAGTGNISTVQVSRKAANWEGRLHHENARDRLAQKRWSVWELEARRAREEARERARMRSGGDVAAMAEQRRALEEAEVAAAEESIVHRVQGDSDDCEDVAHAAFVKRERLGRTRVAGINESAEHRARMFDIAMDLELLSDGETPASEPHGPLQCGQESLAASGITPPESPAVIPSLRFDPMSTGPLDFESSLHEPSDDRSGLPAPVARSGEQAHATQRSGPWEIGVLPGVLTRQRLGPGGSTEERPASPPHVRAVHSADSAARMLAEAQGGLGSDLPVTGEEARALDELRMAFEVSGEEQRWQLMLDIWDAAMARELGPERYADEEDAEIFHSSDAREEDEVRALPACDDDGDSFWAGAGTGAAESHRSEELESTTEDVLLSAPSAPGATTGRCSVNEAGGGQVPSAGPAGGDACACHGTQGSAECLGSERRALSPRQRRRHWGTGERNRLEVAVSLEHAPLEVSSPQATTAPPSRLQAGPPDLEGMMMGSPRAAGGPCIDTSGREERSFSELPDDMCPGRLGHEAAQADDDDVLLGSFRDLLSSPQDLSASGTVGAAPGSPRQAGQGGESNSGAGEDPVDLSRDARLLQPEPLPDTVRLETVRAEPGTSDGEDMVQLGSDWGSAGGPMAGSLGAWADSECAAAMQSPRTGSSGAGAQAAASPPEHSNVPPLCALPADTTSMRPSTAPAIDECARPTARQVRRSPSSAGRPPQAPHPSKQDRVAASMAAVPLTHAVLPEGGGSGSMRGSLCSERLRGLMPSFSGAVDRSAGSASGRASHASSEDLVIPRDTTRGDMNGRRGERGARKGEGIQLRPVASSRCGQLRSTRTAAVGPGGGASVS
ncbi:unnamed protein product [Pedinophyceae sp. YPF-701]|nr:unnamed protein product [Pedinophyceae sp. YPF-701]